MEAQSAYRHDLPLSLFRLCGEQKAERAGRADGGAASPVPIPFGAARAIIPNLPFLKSSDISFVARWEKPATSRLPAMLLPFQPGLCPDFKSRRGVNKNSPLPGQGINRAPHKRFAGGGLLQPDKRPRSSVTLFISMMDPQLWSLQENAFELFVPGCNSINALQKHTGFRLFSETVTGRRGRKGPERVRHLRGSTGHCWERRAGGPRNRHRPSEMAARLGG